MFTELGKQYDHREKQMSQAVSLGGDDPRAYLRGAGALAGGLGDLMAAPFEALTPEWAEKLIGEGAEYVLDSKLGQYGQKLAKENPEAAKDLGAAINIMGVIPIVRILTKAGLGAIKGAAKTPKGSSLKTIGREAVFGGLPNFASDVARNMNTHVRGGMFGDAKDLVTMMGKPKSKSDKFRSLSEISQGRNKFIGSGFNFYSPAAPLAVAGEALNAIPGTLREAISPSRLARREETGYSNNFWDEAEKLRKDQDRSGVAGAEMMQQQMSQGIDKIQPKLRPHGSPLEIDQRMGKPLDMNIDGEAIKKVSMKGMPDDVASHHLDHVSTAWGIPSSETTKVMTMRPGKGGVGMEASGAASTSAPITRRWEDGSLLKTYAKMTGKKQLSAIDHIETTQIAGAVNKKNREKLNKHFKDVIFGEQVGTQVNRKHSAFRTIKASIDSKKGANVLPEGKLMDLLLTARHKESQGIPLGAQERRYIDGWKAIGYPLMQVKDYSGNVVSNKVKNAIKEPVGKYITGTGSHLSRDKEKGGVNYKFTTDLDKNETHLTTSDASDLAGYKGPEKSDNIVVVVPAQKIRHGKRGASKAEKENWGTSSPITSKEWNKSMDVLNNLTGGNLKTAGTTAKAIHRNLLKTATPTVLNKHRRKAASNAAQIGLFTTQMDNSQE